MWRANWVYLPEGFDTSNLFLWADMDGERRKLDLGYYSWRYRSSMLVDGVENLIPIMVRNVPGSHTPDVLIECVRYRIWSEERLSSKDPLPYTNCLPETN